MNFNGPKSFRNESVNALMNYLMKRNAPTYTNPRGEENYCIAYKCFATKANSMRGKHTRGGGGRVHIGREGLEIG